MGVDISIIIKHDFYELDDYQKSRQFVKETIERINDKLGIDDPYDDSQPHGIYDEEEQWTEIGMHIPIFDVIVNLRRGYWSISPGWHYCQVAMKSNGRLHISDLAYKLAQLFDQDEAWYCNEYIDEECMMLTLDELIKEATRQHGIAEYPYAEFMKHKDRDIPEYRHFYHDTFEQRNE